jgi:hypothetical protein
MNGDEKAPLRADHPDPDNIDALLAFALVASEIADAMDDVHMKEQSVEVTEALPVVAAVTEIDTLLSMLDEHCTVDANEGPHDSHIREVQYAEVLPEGAAATVTTPDGRYTYTPYRTNVTAQSKFYVKPAFRIVLDRVEAVPVDQDVFTYEELTNHLSAYILENQYRFFGEDTQLAIVGNDPLGRAFGVTSFHRTQVTGLLKQQLIPFLPKEDAKGAVCTTFVPCDTPLCAVCKPVVPCDIAIAPKNSQDSYAKFWRKQLTTKMTREFKYLYTVKQCRDHADTIKDLENSVPCSKDQTRWEQTERGYIYDWENDASYYEDWEDFHRCHQNFVIVAKECFDSLYPQN